MDTRPDNAVPGGGGDKGIAVPGAEFTSTDLDHGMRPDHVYPDEISIGGQAVSTGHER